MNFEKSVAQTVDFAVPPIRLALNFLWGDPHMGTASRVLGGLQAGRQLRANLWHAANGGLSGAGRFSARFVARTRQTIEAFAVKLRSACAMTAG